VESIATTDTIAQEKKMLSPIEKIARICKDQIIAIITIVIVP
jgi:hypothetical protein